MLLVSAFAKSQALNEDEKFYSQHFDEILALIRNEHPLGELMLGRYALIDIDGDGIKELWIKDVIDENGAFVCRGGGKLEIIALQYQMMTINLYGNTICQSGHAGTGAFYARYVKLENSAVAEVFTDLQLINFETEEEEHECTVNDKDISYEDFLKIENALPKPKSPKAKMWQSVERLGWKVE